MLTIYNTVLLRSSIPHQQKSQYPMYMTPPYRYFEKGHGMYASYYKHESQGKNICTNSVALLFEPDNIKYFVNENSY